MEIPDPRGISNEGGQSGRHFARQEIVERASWQQNDLPLAEIEDQSCAVLLGLAAEIALASNGAC